MSNIANSPETAPDVGGYVVGNVARLLRLEGAVVVVLTGILYYRSSVSWWLFVALWLIPDLSMLGFLAGPRWGTRCYNTFHTYALPLGLAAVALSLHGAVALTFALPVALVWANHIGVDRACGYGLKYPEGFGFTHLNSAGKRTA